MRIGVFFLLAFALAAPARGDLRTYPGAPPCDTTLKACVDGASSGDEIEIALSMAIDESFSISKSLTLRPATGFAPVIGAGGVIRVVDLSGVGSAGSDENVVIEGLTFDNALIDGVVEQGTGHSIVIRDNWFLLDAGNNNTGPLDLDIRVTAAVTVAGNQISSSGPGVRLRTIVEDGTVDCRVERNVITTSVPDQSYAGIYFDMRSFGGYSIEAQSNVVYGVGGCNCGLAGGIVIDVSDAPFVVASVTNNTVHGTETTDGIRALVRVAEAMLELNLFNNSASGSDGAGFHLDNSGGGALTLHAGANNSYQNGVADDFAGLNAGTVTSFPPQYADAGAGDLRLLPTSQLVDAGVDAPSGGTSSLDAAGAARLQGAHIDVGAYEQAPEPAVGALGLAALGALLGRARARRHSAL